MNSQREIEAAYKTLLDTMDELPERDFTLEQRCRIEGAADALNWVLNNDELASIFNTNLLALRHELTAQRGQ